ncbi:MAG: hypothetical protein Q9160_003218 [Pyrenula sp. 1 TL-2023]
MFELKADVLYSVARCNDNATKKSSTAYYRQRGSKAIGRLAENIGISGLGAYDLDLLCPREVPTMIIRSGYSDNNNENDNEDAATNPRDMLPLILHPKLLSQRLSIPTVHVIGKRDLPSVAEKGLLAKDMCDPKLANVVYHSGGHVVPGQREDLRKGVRAMEWAIGMAEGL